MAKQKQTTLDLLELQKDVIQGELSRLLWLNHALGFVYQIHDKDPKHLRVSARDNQKRDDYIWHFRDSIKEFFGYKPKQLFDSLDVVYPTRLLVDNLKALFYAQFLYRFFFSKFSTAQQTHIPSLVKAWNNSAAKMIFSNMEIPLFVNDNIIDQSVPLNKNGCAKGDIQFKKLTIETTKASVKEGGGVTVSFFLDATIRFYTGRTIDGKPFTIDRHTLLSERIRATGEDADEGGHL